MQRRLISIFATMLVMALALAGCGSAKNTSSTATLAMIKFKSVAISFNSSGVRSIPALYTCDGADTSPPVEWGPVPADTAQLVLFVLGFTTSPNGHSAVYSVEWALAGINPALHRLDAGQIPSGAYPGIAASGKRRYSICPRRGTDEGYIFELYGLPKGVAISPNFTGVPILNALASTGRGAVTNAHGAFTARYRRT